MFNINENEKKPHNIIWNEINLNPSIQLKFGIKRKVFPLTRQFTKSKGTLYYVNNYVELTGKWDNSPGFSSLLSLKLKNISDSSMRIARLVFPAENGLDNFLNGFNPNDISFLRNGYQSWSTARSYKIKEKPLRPWLQLVSLTSSNMANLPSNTPGILSSEMFCLISDLKSNHSFLIGQSVPFNQFFYIRLKLHRRESKLSHFELVYDFGRKMIMPGETIKLDGIIMALGQTDTLLSKYFSFIKNQLNIKLPEHNLKGWSTWYYYENKISPNIIYKNIAVIKEHNFNINYLVIDDGYQKLVGDWLELTPGFQGRMKEIADYIKESGYMPGLWLAPFIADKKSELVNIHPEYILRNEYGQPIICGYNPVWPGKFYYGMDITNPRYEEYIRKVIHTIVHQWGFQYLKLDFLFGGCIRGGNHHNLSYSRAEVLKYGIQVIREAAGKEIILCGCGMPLSAGIGMVDLMRVGPDTGPYWKKMIGTFLQTGAMLGVRNSIRNFMARSAMNKCLWLNDPDALILREKKTRLNPAQRQSQINAIILSGGVLTIGDNLQELSPQILKNIEKILIISNKCYEGEALAIDLMEQALPEIYYNTAGFIGIFNYKNKIVTKQINFNRYPIIKYNFKLLIEEWTNEKFKIENGILNLKKMAPYSSYLFRII